MSLDVFFKDDIEHTLRALDVVSAATVARMATNARDAAYREGYADALRAVALAFGIHAAHGERPRIIDAGQRGQA